MPVFQASVGMYISSLSLKNIRGFRNLEIDSHYHGGEPRKLLITGKNGTGKTTLLRAIAIGLCDEADASGLISEPIGSLITEGESEAEIYINFGFSIGQKYETRTVIKRVGDKDTIDNQKRVVLEEPFVCGYGAGRSGIGPETKREYRIKDSVYGLFNYRHLLMDPELTLRRLRDYYRSDSTYTVILDRIKKGLGLSSDDEILLPTGGGVRLSGPSIGKEIPLEGWADGYRLTFNWLIDLYGWALRSRNGLLPEGHVQGIVLIDEVEQHLHPSLQTEILPRLLELLPHVQLFATTHSPLVALGASPEDVIALHREDHEVVKEEMVPDFTGYSAEDMLVDERLFNTPNVYSPETNRKLAEYNKLAAIPKNQRNLKQTNRLRTLAQELRSQQVPEVRQSEMDPALQALMQKHGL
jgi:predicted ATPase